MGRGYMVPLTPNIKKILKILLPTTLPTAISEFFLYAATTLVANSGNEVPTATTVSPRTDWLIPKDKATFIIWSTNNLPPITNPIIPAPIHKMDLSFDIILIFSCSSSFEFLIK